MINIKGTKIMLLGITFILIGLYIGIEGLSGVRTGGKEVFFILSGAVISLVGFVKNE